MTEKNATPFDMWMDHWLWTLCSRAHGNEFSKVQHRKCGKFRLAVHCRATRSGYRSIETVLHTAASKAWDLRLTVKDVMGNVSALSISSWGCLWHHGLVCLNSFRAVPGPCSRLQVWQGGHVSSPRPLHATGCTCKLMQLSQELQLLLESVDGALCSAGWTAQVTGLTGKSTIFWQVELWEMAPVVNFLSGLSADMTVLHPKLCFLALAMQWL